MLSSLGLDVCRGGESEEMEVGQKVLLRFLFLVLMLDKANSEGRMEWRHKVGLKGVNLPLLFRTDSPIRSSNDMLKGKGHQPGICYSHGLPSVSLARASARHTAVMITFLTHVADFVTWAVKGGAQDARSDAANCSCSICFCA